MGVPGCTIKAYLLECSPARRRTTGVHRLLYSFMVKKAAGKSSAKLERRIRDSGLNWEPLQSNLRKLPSCIPRGHCVTYFQYLLKGYSRQHGCDVTPT